MEKIHSTETCTKALQSVSDALYVLNGKWKLQILISLSFGPKRFSEMRKDIPRITDRMLSKELRELETNLLVKRTVYDSVPVVVEYTQTEYGKTLDNVIQSLHDWGAEHRRRIISNMKADYPVTVEADLSHVTD